eukprot:scaffold10482_cov116-Isochrysis_galbana.AAC.10
MCARLACDETCRVGRDHGGGRLLACGQPVRSPVARPAKQRREAASQHVALSTAALRAALLRHTQHRLAVRHHVRRALAEDQHAA